MRTNTTLTLAQQAHPLFTEVAPPAPHMANVLNGSAIWLTWSSQFREFAARWCDSSAALRPPRLTTIANRSSYGRTYTSDLPLSHFDPQLEEFACSLARVQPDDRVVLLDGLLDESIDGTGLASLLAALRDSLVRVHREPGAALYAPLGTIGESAGGFRLHADLYVPHKLMNVFEEVPSDSSGASLFLSKASLMTALVEAEVPRARIDRIRGLLEHRLASDGFEDLQRLVYPRVDATWVVALGRTMSRMQLRIRLGRGQGYLINDRRWLHGREAPTGGVSPRRLHRLVFS